MNSKKDNNFGKNMGLTVLIAVAFMLLIIFTQQLINPNLKLLYAISITSVYIIVSYMLSPDIRFLSPKLLIVFYIGMLLFFLMSFGIGELLQFSISLWRMSP